MEWALKYANYVDPSHRREWMQLCGNTGDGFILRAITTEFKFVGLPYMRSVYGTADVTDRYC